MNLSRFLILGAFLLGLIGAVPAGAQQPPRERVGRVAVADGEIASRGIGAADWTEIGLNDPIAAGMAVRAKGQGRAELRIGAEIVALAPGSEIEIVQLDTSGTQMVLRRGRVGVRLSNLDPARGIAIDVPHGSVWLLTPGDYDIAVGDERETVRLAVIDGRARFTGRDSDAVVATGAVALLRSGESPPTTPDMPADEFIAWWRPPPTDSGEPATLRYVAAEMTGHETLDAFGTWRTVAGAGAVWFPTTAPEDWAPYRFGRWRWVAPWGWTWIDDQPWGFAPSHYGRWAKFPAGDDAGRWGWVPGKPVTHPAYLPAAVAFLGTAGVGMSYPGAFAPAVAWFPLAPGEVYWPSFTDDQATIQQLNADTVDDPTTIGAGVNGEPPIGVVTGAYRNRRFASVVPRPVFLGGKPVGPAVIDLPEQRLDNAPLLAGSPQLAPIPARPPAPPPVMAGERRVPARLVGAVHTLARMLKPGVARAAVPARPIAAPAHVARAKPARPRIVGAPLPRPAGPMRQAEARRR